MITLGSLTPAFEKLYDAALIGDGWGDALEALSRAAGSRGVVLMHNRNRKLVAAISSDGVREPVRDYLAGKAPGNSRQVRVSHEFEPGFRVDYDDYRTEDIASDPYYQEYLRPIGLFWHANARLKMEGEDEVAVGFKRELKHGAYEETDKRMLDLMLPHLRACARVAECIFDAETRGLVRAFHQRGRPVLEFDAWGRVRREYGCFDGSEGPLMVRSARAITAERQAQIGLDKAIMRAVRQPEIQSAIMLHDGAGKSHVFQIVPIIGRARDVFQATSAVGVLISQHKHNAIRIDRSLAIDLFGLTVREAQVVELICVGYSVREIAVNLGVVSETIRYHLKSIFEKTGRHKQADIVALFARLAG